ncbi:MAG: hypothetical protein NTY64_12065 [Deltaproteobacteria bacterium]|nr:hypothetical protein [Deltaproteobacteria bacterium]
MRFTFVAAAYHPSTPHSGGFARLASGAFYEAISLTTFYEIIKFTIGAFLNKAEFECRSFSTEAGNPVFETDENFSWFK